MYSYIISCCSTADMSAEFFEEKQIPFAKFHFSLDGEHFLDDLGKSMPSDMFYEKIAKGALTSTSQVNPEEYIYLFKPILQAGKDILHISLSSGISGTFNSAGIAKEILRKEFPDRRIVIIDSLGASSGYGLLVTLALEMREKGCTLDEAAEWIMDNKLKIHHWFFSTDLTCYFRGGRISRTAALFGNTLNIYPLLNMNNEGKLVPISKHHGKKKVIDALIRKMVQHAEGGLDYSGKCYISHSAFYDTAKAIANMIEAKFPNLNGKVLINNVGTTIGSHTGPGTIALFFIGDKRVD